jgi:hypothetical protein
MTRAELEDQVEAGWRLFRAAVAALAEEDFSMVTPSGWTIKEMLAHVAFWEETVAPFVDGMLRGRDWPHQADWHGGGGLDSTSGWPAAEVHNAREAAWSRARSVAEVVARWDRAHARCLALVRDLSEAELADARFAEGVKAQTYGHYPDHVAELQTALAGRKG